MADELKVTIQATLTNGYLKESINPGQQSLTQAAVGSHCPVVSVGTSEEDLSTGDISTLGWLFITNLDTANYVTYGPKSGGSMVAFGRIESGETHAVRLSPGITLRWQANTAAVKVKVWVLED